MEKLRLLGKQYGVNNEVVGYLTLNQSKCEACDIVKMQKYAQIFTYSDLKRMTHSGAFTIINVSDNGNHFEITDCMDKREIQINAFGVPIHKEVRMVVVCKVVKPTGVMYRLSNSQGCVNELTSRQIAGLVDNGKVLCNAKVVRKRISDPSKCDTIISGVKAPISVVKIK